MWTIRDTRRPTQMRTPGAALLVVLILAFVPAESPAAPVTFSCDMRIELSFERFTPGVDTLVLRGAFNGWTGHEDGLTDSDGDGVYEITLDLSAGSYPYKFVIPLPTYDRWEHFVNDRVVTVGGDPLVIDPVFFDHHAGWMPGETKCGADISFTHQIEAAGGVYRVDGVPVNLFEACADHGYEIIRLRLWHTPWDPWHALPATILMAQEAKAAGLEFMLDFHYSDTWADPGKQYKPAAWEGITFAALVDSMYAYTNGAIRAFRDAGALPDYVQIGNEVSNGMLWDDGRVGGQWDTPEQWDNFAELLSAGVSGVRDSLNPSEQPTIIIHHDQGASVGTCEWYYDNLVSRGVSFDCIGLSFYPWWHGDIWGLRDNLENLAPRYGREIMVVETSYPWTLDWVDDGTNNFVWQESQLHTNYPATPDGQFAFLRDVVAVVEATPGGLGTGVLTWEPGFISVPGGPGSPSENLATFDFDGDATRGFGFPQPWGTGVDTGNEPGDDVDPAEGTGEEHGSRAILSPAVPNPFRGSSTLSLTIPAPGARALVRVFDVSGRLVTTLVDGHLTDGRHDLYWDGTNDAGRSVASGVYLIGAVVGGDRETARLVHLR